MNRPVRAAALAVLAVASPVAAQDTGRPRVSVEAISDDRQRGLSWSDGRPTAAIAASAVVGGALALDLRASALRGSARHGGGDAALRASAGYRHYAGGWVLSADATARVFPGRSGLHYGEVAARAGYALGPAQVSAGAAYAPRQDAIGGDNLYLGADAELGVPGTAFTLYGGIGRSSGAVRDPVRAARLRPDGSYRDYRIGVEYVRSPFALGVRLTGTSVDGAHGPFADRHVGERLSAYLSAAL